MPSHWKETKLKHVLSKLSRVKQPNAELLVCSNKGKVVKRGDSKLGLVAESDEIYQGVCKNDLLIHGMDTWHGAIAISDYDGMCTPVVHVCESKQDKHYIAYYLQFMAQANVFKLISNGIRQNTSDFRSWDKVGAIPITLPTISEQQAIVAYLKDKTLKIDQYVAARERERELLESLKQSEIANVVTKGLNPNAPMKDSGIPWIGMIPEHWEVRTLSQMAKEHFISNKNVHHQNLLSLSYGKIVNKDINTTEGLLPASFDGYQIVENGNIVLRLTDLQNDHKSLRVGLSTQEGIITSAYLAIQTFSDIIPQYLYFLLHTIDIKKVFYSMGNGLRQSLNWAELRKLKCVVPPLSEQQAIVTYIDEKLSKIDRCLADLQAEIDYLKEFKQRLISDAVTGQICITNEIK